MIKIFLSAAILVALCLSADASPAHSALHKILRGSLPPNPSPKLDVPALIEYLQWTTRFGDANFNTEFLTAVSEILALPTKIRNTYNELIDDAQDFFEASSLYEDFEKTSTDSLEILYNSSREFFLAWLEADEEVEQKFQIWLDRLSPLLHKMSVSIVSLHHKLVDFAPTFLASADFENLAGLMNETLISLEEKKETLHNLWHGPRPEEKVATKLITGDDLAVFYEKIGKLDAGKIIGGLVEARRRIQEQGQLFKVGFYGVLQAGGGKELADRGQAIMMNHEQFHHGKLLTVETIFRLLLNRWYYGEPGSAFMTLTSLQLAVESYFARAPTAAIETIHKLEELASEMAPEFVQRAEALRDETLNKVDEIVQTYMDNWRP